MVLPWSIFKDENYVYHKNKKSKINYESKKRLLIQLYSAKIHENVEWKEAMKMLK